MIEIKNISKSFGDRKILNDISTTFDPGKVNLVIGRSGSGKTVFLKCMVGLLEPDLGTVSYDEKIFTTANEEDRKKMRQDIGMVFQGGALFDSLTVAENVRFPLEMFSHLSEKEQDERVEFCLQRVNLTEAAKLYPAEISGGMKKRTAIARAISMNPKYLFCDEPNSGLDPETSILIDQLVLELTHEFKMTTVIITHDMNSVFEIGEKVMFLSGGEKIWEGKGKDIFESTNERLKEFIFASELMKRFRKT